MSPFLAMKILNISSSASDRSSLFFRRNRLLYFLYHTLKLSQKTRCTILMCLGQEDCSPSILGLFAHCAAKLLNNASCFLQRFFRLRNNRSFFTPAALLSLKEICKNLEILRQMIRLLSTTEALFTNASRNQVVS